MTLRAGLLLLCCPLLGCATARVVRLDTGEGTPIVYTPARKVPPVEIDQREFEKAMTTLLLEMKFSLSDEGHPHLRLASETEVPGGRYHRWCSRQSSPGECLSLLEGGLSLADASVRRQLALSFAWDGVWDGVASEVRGFVNPDMLKLMITAAFAAYVGLLIFPEPVTKAVAVALTTFLIAYVGLEVFFNILDGWRVLSARSERAVSFGELEDAGHRFGDVMGRDGARVIIMAVTAALGGGAAHLASKAPMLPGFARAVLAARTNAGFELSVAPEGGARTVTVAEGVMTVGVAPNVVAAVAADSPGGAIRPGGLGSGVAKQGQAIALGLRDGLDDFAKSVGGSTWKEWAASNPDRWRSAFLDVVSNPSNKVKFDLTGVDDPWRAVTRAASGRGGATDWELLQIKNNPGWWDRITFFKDRAPVPNPFQ